MEVCAHSEGFGGRWNAADVLDSGQEAVFVPWILRRLLLTLHLIQIRGAIHPHLIVSFVLHHQMEEEEVRILLMEEEEEVVRVFQVDLVQVEVLGKEINLHIEVTTILLALTTQPFGPHQILMAEEAQEEIQVVIQAEIHHSQIEMKDIRSEGYKCYWQRQIICTIR